MKVLSHPKEVKMRGRLRHGGDRKLDFFSIGKIAFGNAGMLLMTDSESTPQP